MTEAQLVAYLCERFDGWGWNYKREVQLENKKRIDFVLYQGQEPFYGIEVKKNLTEHTKIGEFAEHFEQCSSYADLFGVPVFLALMFTRKSFCDVVHGGAETTAHAAFCALAGRRNVGLITERINTRRTMTMILRSQRVWDSDTNEYIEAAGTYAVGAGSIKVRVRH